MYFFKQNEQIITTMMNEMCETKAKRHFPYYSASFHTYTLNNLKKTANGNIDDEHSFEFQDVCNSRYFHVL